ncbi:hypothetical protein UT300012_22380 [Paraclostridium bifermentans]
MAVVVQDLETNEECYVVCPECRRHDRVTIEGVEDGDVTYDCSRCDADYLFTSDEAILVPVEDIEEGEYDPDDEDYLDEDDI